MPLNFTGDTTGSGDTISRAFDQNDKLVIVAITQESYQDYSDTDFQGLASRMYDDGQFTPATATAAARVEINTTAIQTYRNR